MQRTQVFCNSLLRAQQIALVSITDSAIVQGCTTAASWFGVDIAAFAWNNVNEAMSWLKLDSQSALDAMSAEKANKYAVDQKLAARTRRSSITPLTSPRRAYSLGPGRHRVIPSFLAGAQLMIEAVWADRAS